MSKFENPFEYLPNVPGARPEIDAPTPRPTGPRKITEIGPFAIDASTAGAFNAAAQEAWEQRKQNNMENHTD